MGKEGTGGGSDLWRAWARTSLDLLLDVAVAEQIQSR